MFSLWASMRNVSQASEARPAQAARQARLETGQTELETGRRQSEALRTQLSTKPDPERTARKRSERTAEGLRKELAAAQRGARCGGGASGWPR